MSISEKLEDRKIERKLYYLFGITGFFFLLFFCLFLVIPTEEEKVVFGTVEKRNCVKLIINRDEVNEFHTWTYQNQHMEIEKIEEQLYMKEDGNIYQVLWVNMKLPEKENHVGNFVSLKLIRKERKWKQVKRVLRSVIN